MFEVNMFEHNQSMNIKPLYKKSKKKKNECNK